MWVEIHTCMEAMLGISLYSYLYLKLGKMIGLYYLLRFLFNSENKRAEQVLLRSGEESRGEVAQTMCTHVSKCKKDKIKKEDTLS
jgi:hypothetical protein